MKIKKRNYWTTRPPKRRLKLNKNNKKAILPNFIILIHKINVNGMSRQHAEEIIYNYKNNILKNLEELNIKNIILPITDSSEPSDVKLIYPTNDLSSLDPLSDIPGYKRKIKMFKLLEEIEESIKNKFK